jgi:hypothetical protein
MGEELERILAKARRFTMSATEREEQRRSFAYGNTAIENRDISRRLVNEEARRLAAGKAKGG